MSARGGIDFANIGIPVRVHWSTAFYTVTIPRAEARVPLAGSALSAVALAKADAQTVNTCVWRVGGRLRAFCHFEAHESCDHVKQILRRGAIGLMLFDY